VFQKAIKLHVSTAGETRRGLSGGGGLMSKVAARASNESLCSVHSRWPLPVNQTALEDSNRRLTDTKVRIISSIYLYI
jgi:hypothetical protein